VGKYLPQKGLTMENKFTVAGLPFHLDKMGPNPYDTKTDVRLMVRNAENLPRLQQNFKEQIPRPVSYFTPCL
ncbi:MAG TPA: hypothetical protein PL061_09075, partial [Syntrophales bacterium]|nr:hypothetical protein [Syntrophales bacterium]HRR47742.1 hypothetical protein [Syntrophales bacterium]